jgi:hypothetical protein
MKLQKGLTLALVFVAASFSASGQLLDKIKNKAAKKAEKALDKKLGIGDDKNKQQPNDTPNDTHDPHNKGGGGLVTTPPDVNQNLADAETAYKSGGYGEARYALQQAMLGVEMEIGSKVLESLPSSIIGLDRDENEDKVTSTGWGWAGLTIQREYGDGKDKQLNLTVANNSIWMSSVNMYLNGGYSQTTGGEQNWKQTKVKGHRAIIEYHESSGYKLSVPLGQSSLIVYQGINFANEAEMMEAAESVDIDGIKSMLGEQ